MTERRTNPDPLEVLRSIVREEVEPLRARVEEVAATLGIGTTAPSVKGAPGSYGGLRLIPMGANTFEVWTSDRRFRYGAAVFGYHRWWCTRDDNPEASHGKITNIVSALDWLAEGTPVCDSCGATPEIDGDEPCPQCCRSTWAYPEVRG